MSGESAAWRDPRVRLPRGGRDVLEVGVVVQDDRAMVFGRRGGKQIDHSSGTVVASDGQWTPTLSATGTISR